MDTSNEAVEIVFGVVGCVAELGVFVLGGADSEVLVDAGLVAVVVGGRTIVVGALILMTEYSVVVTVT